MPLSGVDLAWVRSQAGATTPPSDADLDASYDLLGSREAVALGVLEGRLAALTSSPSTVKIANDIEWQLDPAAIAVLRANVERLRAMVAPAAPLVGGLTHDDRGDNPDRDPDLIRPYFYEDMFEPTYPDGGWSRSDRTAEAP